MQLGTRERGARRGDQPVEHLLRRAGFGASQEEVDLYADSSHAAAVRRLVDYDDISDDVDALIGQAGFATVTGGANGFTPGSNIAHARQRWLFRMVHTRRPLQEKMALFWHNHFATAYSKVAGAYGAAEGARYMAATAGEDPAGVKGQIEVLRENALGNFRDLLTAMAKDVAMLVWLDGRLNVRNRPQENFARELMELFTMGVGTFEEADVYAAARVFTGWNLTRPGGAYYTFNYAAAQHDTAAKEFSFPVYPDGARTIPARSADAGMQDGLDLIAAVARHPATGPRLALKLYRYFVSEVDTPDGRLIEEMSRLYYQGNFEMKPVVRHLLLSTQFTSQAARYARYSWPVEYVVRAIKEVGSAGFSLNSVLTPLANMGQQLYEPPRIAGWELGPSWFSTGAMVARMNFGATLATSQRPHLRDRFTGRASTPEALVELVTSRLTPMPFTADQHRALVDYVRTGLTYTGTDAQIATKASGLAHLIVGSGGYQFV